MVLQHAKTTWSLDKMKTIKSDVNNPLFELGDFVKHLKTGRVYIIVGLPDENDILEYCNLPFYKYNEIDSPKMWNRAQTVMEDGRFVKK